MEYLQPLPSPAVLAAQEEKATNKKLFDKITKDVIRGKRDLGKTPDQIFDELYNEGYRISKIEQ
jgi:hypothetical protein